MMFNNCGNMGLPLAVLAYGAAGFSPMVALFTISNLLHFTLGVWIINHHARFRNLARNPIVDRDRPRFCVRAHASAAARLALGRDQDGRRRVDSDDAALARRAALRSALGRLAARHGRRRRLPADRCGDRACALAAATASTRCSTAS